MEKSFIVGLFILFFCSILLSAYLGKLFALLQAKRHPHHKFGSNKMIESAIFALMGLLIALAFYGARERFDIRRDLVIQEANAIQTAYSRLDLLPKDARTSAQTYFKQYLATRLAIYTKLPHVNHVLPQLNQSYQLQEDIWNISVKSCQQQKTSAICIVLLPALNNMFDLGNARIRSISIHPPSVILSTLIGIALMSAALSGYSSRNKSIFRTMHFIVYAFIISITFFVVIGLEYPSMNLISINYFSNVITDVENRINQTGS
jgi:hypothetical protein